jgi:high frequency lysogenization protein
MAKTDRDRTLALAGVFQAARLVQQTATRGRCDEDSMEASLNSIFCLEPETTADVYGGQHNLAMGLSLMASQLENRTSDRDVEVTKYVLSLLYLERKLSRNKQLMNKLAEGLERTQQQLRHFPVTHPNIIASLADVYVHTVSTLTPRIIINGEQGFLSNPDVANKVRALLLAGMRSAVLWSQNGGSRLKLLFGRKKLMQETRLLLKATTH